MESIVKKLRGELTQMELAKRAGMSQSTLAEYELGRFPKPEILDRIAAAVGKKVVWAIQDRETSEPSETTQSVRRDGVADGSSTKDQRTVSFTGHAIREKRKEGQTRTRGTERRELLLDQRTRSGCLSIGRQDESGQVNRK